VSRFEATASQPLGSMFSVINVEISDVSDCTLADSLCIVEYVINTVHSIKTLTGFYPLIMGCFNGIFVV
jgi:hypothetical protein